MFLWTFVALISISLMGPKGLAASETGNAPVGVGETQIGGNAIQCEGDNCRIEFTLMSFALGLGYSSGDGALIIEGVGKYAFSMKSFDFGSVAATSVTGRGKVRGLSSGDLDKFTGTYTAASTAVAFGAGGGVIVMRNQNGVVITLTSTQVGIQATFGASGMDIELHQ